MANSQEREAGRPACHAAEQVRVRDQPQHRHGIGAQLPTSASRHRGRGDRVKTAMLTGGYGTSRHFAGCINSVAIGGEARRPAKHLTISPPHHLAAILRPAVRHPVVAWCCGRLAWLIPILRLSDLRLPNRGGRWT